MSNPLKTLYLSHKKIFSYGIIYLFFAFLNRSLPFILIPIYSRCLTAEDYGIYALFLTAVTFSSLILTLCWHYGIAYIYFHKQFSIKYYVSTFSFLSLVIFIIQEIFLCIFIGIYKEFSFFFLSAPISAMGNVYISVVNTSYQVQERPLYFGLFHLFCAFTKTVMNITSVLILHLGWRGLFVSEALSSFIAIIAALMLLHRMDWLGKIFDFFYIKIGLKLGVGFLPGILAGIVNDSVGRLLLANRFSVEATGLYSMGQKLGTIAWLYTVSLSNVYQPWLFKVLGSNAKNLGLKIITSQVFAACSIIIFSVISGGVMHFMSDFVLGSTFRASLPYFWLSLSSFSIVGMYNLLAHVVYSTGKTWILSCLTGLAAFFNFSFTYFFIDIFGVIGAGYSSVCSWILTVIIALFVTISVWKKDIVPLRIAGSSC